MGIIGGVMLPHAPELLPGVNRNAQKKLKETLKACEEAGKFIRDLAPETIVFVSPHAPRYYDYFHISRADVLSGDMGKWGAPELTFEEKVDTDFRDALAKICQESKFPAGFGGRQSASMDHGIMVPLAVIREYYGNGRVVLVGTSGLPRTSHYRLGEYMKEVAETLHKRVVVVASGDLSHRTRKASPGGFDAAGPKYDKKMCAIMEEGRFIDVLTFDRDLLQKAESCGHRALSVLAGALDRSDLARGPLSYADPFGVGYAVCSYRVTGPNAKRDFLHQYADAEKKRLTEARTDEDPYVHLAREAAETMVLTGKRLSLPKTLPEAFYKKSHGVFVTVIGEEGKRGSIGTLEPVKETLAEEIISNAVKAVTADSRFSPVSPMELLGLSYDVDLIQTPKKVTDRKELDADKYGLIAQKDDKTGILLPGIEGIQTADAQIAIARHKAGISKQEKGVSLKKFSVERHR